MNTIASILYEQAEVIPGRSLTRSKAPGRMFDVGAGPMFASHGVGAYLFPADDHDRYLDMVCGLGAISLGYGSAYQVREGSLDGVFSLPHVLESKVGGMVLSLVAPWATRVRFTKTGSEATHAAYRIAKRATGRRRVLIGNWAYHGWHEWCERRSDGAAELNTTELFAHGSRNVFEFVAPHSIAAIFIEPHRWEQTDVEWLRWLRDFCTSYGILLVFDEMIYGLRWARGGATEYFGVQPDLACYGKALGNGASIACVVGREVLEEHGEIPSGTYSGDVVGLAAARDVLRAYENMPVIETLWRRGKQLRRNLVAAVDEAGWTERAFVEGAGDPHLRLRFADESLGRVFSAGMAQRRILWHPACANVMLSHTADDIERVGETAVSVLREMAEES